MSEKADKQHCACCGSPDVHSAMVTDKFLYGEEPISITLAAEVLMFSCPECGESYTGEQGEAARMGAVNAHLLKVFPQVLAAVRAEHEAIDRLFALLIAKTMHSEHPFYPSDSGQPWQAILSGKAALEAAGVKL